MHAQPMMNRCATCGAEWWDAHACPKQVLTDGRTLGEWAAAAAASDGWPRLTKPARVGNVTFGVGVSARLVVEAAQRQHEYHAEDASRTPARPASTNACAVKRGTCCMGRLGLNAKLNGGPPGPSV